MFGFYWKPIIIAMREINVDTIIVIIICLEKQSEEKVLSLGRLIIFVL